LIGACGLLWSIRSAASAVLSYSVEHLKNAAARLRARRAGWQRTLSSARGRSNLVTLEDVPRLLVVADVHLVTLRDPFVGYVLPSKIHACIESGKRILFIGSPASDVHHLAAASLAAGQYRRVDVGNVEGAVVALKSLENDVARERGNDVDRRREDDSVVEARPAIDNAVR
jgi:hypothetical protein